MVLHNQLLVNGYSKRPITDVEQLKVWLHSLVLDIDMKIILGPYAFYVEKEGNRGITGFVGIETSHIAVHVWDEQSPASVQFDLYTCSSLPMGKVMNALKQDWGLFDAKHMLLERETGFIIKELTNI